ncbi:Ppx/GppA phosphatase family protein [Thermosediminibacter oceani]|uniref:Ppx/GppA phosphatase n=1 Tax=Thermosediminibacter oceani (strain ATCC BAA-1034 / DSM 16646 / JW/IW-1228P) TaxID=555079 RepID=D9RZK3_THEOJ|nr:Ppx/GppA phosphatase family protein [Thermosediminibacter oceani]ADL06901.1 Ppx/GppA phosphatase [Thermosediminibacter oceani DSM 16646]
MKAAVIDLGSNSVRLLVAEVGGGKVTPVLKDLVTTRLGEGVADKGMLSQKSMDSTLEAVIEFKKRALSAGCERITAIATSAVREAKNGWEFMELIKQRAGIEVRILSGREEGELSFLGAKEGLGLKERALVIDIGGGSTELAFGCEKVQLSVSLPMGAVRWTRSFLKSDPPEAKEITALREEARSLLSDFKNRFESMKSPGGVTAVGVGGTLTSLAAISLELKEYHWSKVHGCVLALKAMEEIAGRLCRLPSPKRKEIAGLAADRADIIPAGALIALEIMRFLELGSITVSESDLMEGILLTN